MLAFNPNQLKLNETKSNFKYLSASEFEMESEPNVESHKPNIQIKHKWNDNYKNIL